MKRFQPHIFFSVLILSISVLITVLATNGKEATHVSVSARGIKVVEPVLKVKVNVKNSIDSYRGLGAWVDSFDADPNYLRGSATVFHQMLLKCQIIKLEHCFFKVPEARTVQVA